MKTELLKIKIGLFCFSIPTAIRLVAWTKRKGRKPFPILLATNTLKKHYRMDLLLLLNVTLLFQPSQQKYDRCKLL